MTMDDLAINICLEPEDLPPKRKETSTKNSGIKRKSLGEDSSEFPNKFEKGKKRKLQGNDDYFKTKNDKSNGHNTGYISSLFGKYSDVPLLEHKEVDPISEPVFSSETFKEFKDIHPFMVQNLEQSFGITKLTTVQRLSFPELISGKDALIRSQTGSGKTLAYAIPIIQHLQEIRPKLSRTEGVKALVVLPTRELALQTYECFLKLSKSFTWIVPGMLAGGEKRKSEKARLRRGITILVGTPGRILDHADHTEAFSLQNVRWFVLDEADKLLNMDYEKDISRLLEILNKQRADHYSSLKELPKRQTVLLSATLTPAVEKLAGLTLETPAKIDSSLPGDSSDFVIPQSLTQKYIITQPKLRLVTLASFIIRKCEVAKQGAKMLVFMATQNMVDFHTDLLTTVLPKSAEFFKLHGSMSQPERTQVFKSFRAANAGVLFCTDVAARGLDLPKVDWILQYTAPATTADYVHRVGRAARAGQRGSALLFLTPSEMPFLEELNSSRFRVEEENLNYCLESLLLVNFASNENKKRGWGAEDAATELQLSFEQAVLQQEKLHNSACSAYRSWIKFYASYPKESRKCFKFKDLHLGHYAKSFALRDPPGSIGGIGRPSKKQLKKSQKNERSESAKGGGGEQPGRNRQLLVSEFDSGLKPLRKSR